jgi:hypothetical protein
MKRVIFVGGTEFSGSTFFHMILANDPAGFAIGEAHNFLRPSKPWHYDMRCGCGEHPCELWAEIRREGERRLYDVVFEHFPDVDFIVDSSKNPFWIRTQMANLASRGQGSDNVLIWKTPYEFAHSYKKRGNLRQWERSWVVYHRMYATFFPDWRAVRYRALTSEKKALLDICDTLGLPYFPGKERYWEKGHHVIGGNPSARVHLYSEQSAAYRENVRRSTSKITAAEEGTHQSIYYENPAGDDVRQLVDRQVQANPTIPAIGAMLAERDVSASGSLSDYRELYVPTIFVYLRDVKYRLARLTAGLRYGRRTTSV